MHRVLFRVYRPAEHLRPSSAIRADWRFYGTSLSVPSAPSRGPARQPTLYEATCALRKTAGECAAMAQNAADMITRDTAIDDILSLAHVCKQKRLTQPVLHILLKLELQDSMDPNLVVELLMLMGQAKLYPGQLFEWLSTRINSLSPRGLAIYLYECGRHGLRCKHFADEAVPRAANLVHDMSMKEVMMVTRGLIRFVRDGKIFFLNARPIYQANLANLSDEDWTFVLRVNKELRAMREFRNLQELAVQAKDPDELDVRMIAEALNRLDRHKTIKMARCVQRFVQRCADSLARRTSSLRELSVVEVIDSVDALSTWPPEIEVDGALLQVMGDLLTERITEIKYSPNIALWSRATCAFSKFHFYHEQWMKEITVFARDRYISEKISFFQQCSFVAGLARLGFSDAESYQNIGDILVQDVELVKEPAHVSPLLWSFTIPNQVHRPLFDALVPKIVGWADSPQMNSLIQSLYCFVAAGYHQTHDLTPLYNACFVDEHLRNRLFKQRLQVIRDIVAAELNLSLPAVPDFPLALPSAFARAAVTMVPESELVLTYGPCTLIRWKPEKKYGMLLIDGRPLSTGDPPMEVILQGRILTADGWTLSPPLFARTPTWTEHGERYLQYWASRA